MAKELLKDSATAAVEKLLQSLMPALNARLDALQQQISAFKTDVDRQFAKIDERFEQVEEKFDRLQTKFEDKFERQAELLNELGLRINTVDSKLEAYIDISKIAQSDMHKFLERVVRVEETQKRSRRAS